jgi:uncharacterized OB-fold protein
MASRPLPRFPEPDTQPFWDATREHRLTYQTCNRCGKVIFYPRGHCPSCSSLETTWHDSRGEGTVYTYSVIRLNRHPAFASLGPYAVAWIDLDEGFRMLSNIVGVDDPTKDITIGQRVKVRWEDQEGGLSLPMFEPAR